MRFRRIVALSVAATTIWATPMSAYAGSRRSNVASTASNDAVRHAQHFGASLDTNVDLNAAHASRSLASACGGKTGKDVWFETAVSRAGQLTIDVAATGAKIDPVVAVYRSNTKHRIACNDDASRHTVDAHVRVHVTRGHYLVRVGAQSRAAGNVHVSAHFRASKAAHVVRHNDARVRRLRASADAAQARNRRAPSATARHGRRIARDPHRELRPSERATTQSSTTNATVQGVVRDARTGLGIPDLCVTAFSFGQTVTTTSATGAYTIGAYIPAWWSSSYVQIQAYDCQAGLYSSGYTSLILSAGDVASAADILLQGPPRISGTVRDVLSHAGIPGVCVVFDASYNYGPTYRTVTGADGTYDIAVDAFYGSYGYDVFVRDCNPNPTYRPLQSFVTVWYSSDIQQDFDLQPISGIAGIVTDARSHQGASGVCVQLFDLSGANQLSQTLTSPTGAYTLDGVGAGQYSVRFADCQPPIVPGAPAHARWVAQWYKARASAPGTPVTIVAGLVTGEVNAMLNGGASISGVIRSADLDQVALGGGACAVAYNNDGVAVAGALTSGSSPTGSYRISGLEPGTYRIGFSECDGHRFFGERYWRDAEHLDGATALHLGVNEHRSDINGALPYIGGFIHGTIRNARSHALVDNACVNVWDAVTNSAVSHLIAPSGSYRVNVEAGFYQVEACDTVRGTDMWWPESRQQQGAAIIEITPKQDFTANFNFLYEATISGVVRLPNGEPAANACVTILFPYGYGNGFMTTITGSYRYVSTDPHPQTVTVAFDGCYGTQKYARSYWHGATSFGNATPVLLQLGVNNEHIDGQLVLTASVAGQLTDEATHEPIANECVELWDVASHGSMGFAFSSVTGAYRFDGVSPSRYVVRAGCPHYSEFGAPSTWAQRFYGGGYSFKTATPFEVRSGLQRGDVNIALNHGGSLSGFVLWGPGVIGGGCLEIVNQAGEFTYSNQVRSSNPDRFEFRNLIPGDYKLFFDCPWGSAASQFYRNSGDLQHAQVLHVRAGHGVSGIEFVIDTGNIIVGHVGSRESAMAGARVEAVSLQYGYGQSTYTDLNGNYAVYSLPTGDYKIVVSANRYPSGGYTLASIADDPQTSFPSVWNGGAATFDAAETLHVHGPAATRVDFELQPGGSIYGSVRGADGHALNGLCVSVADVKTRLGFLEAQTQTSVTGAYQLDNLAPGRYLLRFDDCGWAGYATQFSGGVSTPAAATLITVRSGQVTRHVNAVLPRGAMIFGSLAFRGWDITDSQYGVCTRVLDTEGNDVGPIFSEFSGQQGQQFHIGALGTGDYVIEFASCGSYLSSFAPVVRYYGGNSLATATRIHVKAGQIVGPISAVI